MAFRPVDPQVNFPELEKTLLKHWYGSGIVDKYLHKNDSANQNFSFLDGPITANNPMGVHHAWGRTYKDLWQRFWNMRGYKQRFQNGFDCQGLWVEVEVEKDLGLKSKKDIENLVPGDKQASIAKFIDLCKQRVLKYASIQTEQSKRLGYFMDWDHSYFTMSEANNYMIWHFLKRCHEKGYLYKGIDSVPWCPRCGTAISQHEMLTEDYKEITHETVFFKLPIVREGWEHTALLAWTTTPWTVPANAALAVHPDYTYGVWKNDQTGEQLIFIKSDDHDQVPKRENMNVDEYVLLNIQDKYTLVKELKGSELLGLTYRAPFDGLERVQRAGTEGKSGLHKVVNGKDLVTSTEGTGILHVAPGAGSEDFQLGKKENIPVISVIDEAANYLEGMGEFTGKNAKEDPEIILKFLKTHEDGHFWFKKQKITHRYPACWRCKTELVWRVVDEWYIAMDRRDPEDPTGRTLREQMKAVAGQITWMPEFGLARELDWLTNMHDWLISKKRYWGLALPIWECTHCHNFIVVGSREELKSKGVEGWEQFESHTPHRPYVDSIKLKCDKCGQLTSRIPDVGNPWLDAGIVPFSTITEKQKNKLSNVKGQMSNVGEVEITSQFIEQGDPLYLTNRSEWSQWFPADFITESFPGQFKNWFYSMIAMSTVLENQPPYQRVLGFATLLAEDGRPMHKSWGNSIEFNEGADQIGVDVMRFMYALQNPADNMLFGPTKAGVIRRQFHLMLWNIYNFFVTYANVDGWSLKNNETRKQLNNETPILDQWILARLHQTTEVVTQSLESYDATSATKSFQEFIDDLSLWYVRRSRTRLGPTSLNESDKQLCYKTLYQVLTTLAKLLAPITPFLSEEIYTNLTGEESVHLTDWPKLQHDPKDMDNLIKSMELTRKVVAQAHAMRKLNNINVRQPLLKLTYQTSSKLSNDLEILIADEVNVKKIEHTSFEDKSESPVVTLDFEITPELQAEGQARELIRQIQVARKEAGCELTEQISVTLPDWPKDFETDIKRQTLAIKLLKGDQLQILRST